jgi:hypothetical protein
MYEQSLLLVLLIKLTSLCQFQLYLFPLQSTGFSSGTNIWFSVKISQTEKIYLSCFSQGLSRSSSGHSSLANFLSASIAEYVPKISCKLSEDIVRCISAVYCKLASQPSQNLADFETLSTPSFSSSSSTFSLKHRVDSWSPRCHYNVNTSSDKYDSLNEKSEQYNGMIICPRIYMDAEKFEYASKMLETVRSLIKRLEKIDPTKMAHEEQLCFWINIHNALVMHAFMAYGLQEKRMKNTDMILKAAYNVGGLSVNAQIIQNSIIGCQSHRTSVWVRTLFTPLKKSASGSSIHPYALHPPEPLAHFALSTGAISDPPVSRIDMLKFCLQSDHNILTVKSSAGEAVHCQESESSTGSSQD